MPLRNYDTMSDKGTKTTAGLPASVPKDVGSESILVIHLLIRHIFKHKKAYLSH